jgi:hypothetical protein
MITVASYRPINWRVAYLTDESFEHNAKFGGLEAVTTGVITLLIVTPCKLSVFKGRGSFLPNVYTFP